MKRQFRYPHERQSGAELIPSRAPVVANIDADLSRHVQSVAMTGIDDYGCGCGSGQTFNLTGSGRGLPVAAAIGGLQQRNAGSIGVTDVQQF